MFRRKPLTIRARLEDAAELFDKISSDMQARIDAGDLDFDDVIYRSRDAADQARDEVAMLRWTLFQEDDG